MRVSQQRAVIAVSRYTGGFRPQRDGEGSGEDLLTRSFGWWRVFPLFITDLIEGFKGHGAGRTVACQEFGWKGAIVEPR